VSEDEPARIEEENAPAELSIAHARRRHRTLQGQGAAASGGPRTVEHDTLVLEPATHLGERRAHTSHEHARRALDVVVEREDAVSVALVDAERVGAGEIFPLHEG